MKQSFRTVLLICGIFLTTGCAAVLVGAGTGASVYTWVKGELSRTYPNSLKETEAATLKSLQSFQITIDEKTETVSKITLKAHRNDDTSVTVKIETKSYDLTEVSVRCGHVGYWDRDTAEKIHVAILKAL